MPLTSTQIANGIAGRYGNVPMRFRYELRTADYTFIKDVSSAIFPEQVPSLTLDNNRAVIRDLKGLTFEQDDLLTLYPDFSVNNFLAVIEERFIGPPGVAGEWVSFPLGLFVLDTTSVEYHQSGPRLKATGADLSILLTTAGPESAYAVTSGTNYMTAIGDILTDLGLEHDLPSVTETLPVDVSWPAYPETTWYDIVSALALGVNHWTPWPDTRGEFTTREKTDPAEVDVNVTYSEFSEPLLIEDSMPFVFRREPGTLPNVCKVTIGDPAHPDFGAYTASNDDADSEISTVNDQTRVLKVDSSHNPSSVAMYDDEVALEVARWYIRRSVGRIHPATLHTFPDPRRGARETYLLNIDAAHGEGERWTVESWKRALSPRQSIMTHEISHAHSVEVTDG